MAPDKLYISHLIYDTFMYQTPDPDDATQVEYILKDALMEWAREKKKQLFEQESANDEPSDVAAGINAGLDMLIGKLKSM